MDIECTVPTILAISLSNRDSLVSSSAHFCQAVSGYESVSYAKLEYFAALSRQTETSGFLYELLSSKKILQGLLVV
jgi:hypothetical protein